MEAEDILVTMTTRGLPPTPAIMDSFIHGYCKAGNTPSGLSMIQSCFNQYNCRPSLTAFTLFLNSCLSPSQGMVDIYEAQRALVIAEQLWGREELAELEPWRRRLEEESKRRG